MKTQWNPVLNIPEGQRGEYRITHIRKPAGTVLTTANSRCAIIGGQRPISIEFPEETIWHELSYDGGVWMTDLPCEQAQCDAQTSMTVGNVLITGLGLGYAATTIANRDDVDHVTVVEIAPEVIDLVAPHLDIDPDKIEIIEADALRWLEELPPDVRFDSVFHDIWQSDGEGTFHDVVVPLRRLTAEHCDDDNVVCWNEDVMRGQLLMALTSRITMCLNPDTLPASMRGGEPPIDFFARGVPESEPGAIYQNWCAPFFHNMRDVGMDHDAAMACARAYARNYGRF